MAMTLRTLKTDAIDAAMIADLMRYKRYEPCALGDHAQNPRHSHPRRSVPRLV